MVGLADLVISAGVGVGVGIGVQATVMDTVLDVAVFSTPSGSLKVARLVIVWQAAALLLTMAQ